MDDPGVNDWDRNWVKWCIEGAAIFSTCTKAQYMAIVVDGNKRIVGTGYNGAPPGHPHCSDGGCPRAINNVPSGTPYDFGPGLCVANHAEANALMFSDRSMRMGGTLYVNGTPCFNCAKLIAGSGLARVVYLGNEESRLDAKEALEMLAKSGVQTLRLEV